MENKDKHQRCFIIDIGERRFILHEDNLKKHSGYFAGIKRLNGTEEQSKSVKLHPTIVPPQVFARMIPYFVSEHMPLDLEIISDIVNAANYLAVDGLLKDCVQHCIHSLDMTNVLKMHKLGVKGSLQVLLNYILSFLSINFEEFIESRLYLEAPFDLLIGLISSPLMVVKSESFVLIVVCRWIRAKEEERMEHASEVFQSLMIRRLLRKNVMFCIGVSKEMTAQMQSIFSPILFSQEKNAPQPAPGLRVSQRERNYYGGMYIMHGDGIYFRPFERDQLYEKVSGTEILNYGRAATLNRIIYIITWASEFDIASHTFTFDPVKKLYQQVASTAHGYMCIFDVKSHNGKIYMAASQVTGEREHRVGKLCLAAYTPETDSWEHVCETPIGPRGGFKFIRDLDGDGDPNFMLGCFITVGDRESLVTLDLSHRVLNYLCTFEPGKRLYYGGFRKGNNLLLFDLNLGVGLFDLTHQSYHEGARFGTAEERKQRVYPRWRDTFRYHEYLCIPFFKKSRRSGRSRGPVVSMKCVKFEDLFRNIKTPGFDMQSICHVLPWRGESADYVELFRMGLLDIVVM